MQHRPARDNGQLIVDLLVAVLALAALLAIFSPIFGCVEKGAVQISISADVQLDEVRGITLANQQVGERE